MPFLISLHSIQTCSEDRLLQWAKGDFEVTKRFSDVLVQGGTNSQSLAGCATLNLCSVCCFASDIVSKYCIGMLRSFSSFLSRQLLKSDKYRLQGAHSNNTRVIILTVPGCIAHTESCTGTEQMWAERLYQLCTRENTVTRICSNIGIFSNSNENNVTQQNYSM